nr:hypothetical protein GCM10020093_100890 [Planobispora longispora]
MLASTMQISNSNQQPPLAHHQTRSTHPNKDARMQRCEWERGPVPEAKQTTNPHPARQEARNRSVPSGPNSVSEPADPLLRRSHSPQPIPEEIRMLGGTSRAATPPTRVASAPLMSSWCARRSLTVTTWMPAPLAEASRAGTGAP